MGEKNHYSRGDICKMFNIGRDTLRHYQAKGILLPHKNPENDYNEFSASDVNILIEILRYRAWGFSVEDAKKLIYKQDLSSVATRLQERINDLQEKLILDKLLYEKSKRDLQGLSFVKTHLNSYFEENMNALCFLPFKINHKGEASDQLVSGLTNLQFFNVGFYQNENSDIPEIKYGTFGLITEKRFSDLLSIDNGITREASRIICYLFEVIGEGTVEGERLEEFKKEIIQRYNREFEDFFFILITRFYDHDNNLHKYYVMFSPLE